MKWMATEEMQKIHDDIDKRMEELEESGLTREEILFNESVRIDIYTNFKRVVFLWQMTPSFNF